MHNAKAHSTHTHTTCRHRGVNIHETSLGQWRTQWRNLSSFCSQAGELHFVRFLKSIEQKWSIAAASLITRPWNGFLCFLILVPQSCTYASCRSQINHLDANCLRALLSGKPRWRVSLLNNRVSLAFIIYGAGIIGYPYRSNKIWPLLIPHLKKSIFWWIIDLSVQGKTIKPWKVSMREYFHNLRVRRRLLKRIHHYYKIKVW